MNRFCIPKIAVLLLLSQVLIGQSSLSIEQIMQGPDFVGHLPSAPFWSPDGHTLYFRWNPEGLPSSDLYKWRRGEEVTKVSKEERRVVPTGSVIYSKDRNTFLYAKHGDLFLQDKSANSALQITNTNLNERNPRFSGDEKYIIYQLENNLFSWHRASGATKQLTDFRKGKEKQEATAPPYKEWLERDQLEYFQILSKRAEDRKYNEEKSDELKAERPLEIYIGDLRLSNLQLSPKGRYVTYNLMKAPPQQGTKVPDYVTEEGYIKQLPARPKVGTPGSTYQTWIYDMQADTHFAVETNQIPGIYQKPAFLEEYHRSDSTYVDTFPEPREVTILGPIYNETGSRAVVVVRSHDHKDRWIMELIQKQVGYT